MRTCLAMLATSPPMIFKNDFSKLVSKMAWHFNFIFIKESLSRYARHLATNYFEELCVKLFFMCESRPCQQGLLIHSRSLTKLIGPQLSDIKRNFIESWMIRHLFFLKPANHICCEFFGFRYTRYAPSPQHKIC